MTEPTRLPMPPGLGERIKARMAALPPDLPQVAMDAIRNAEANFWLRPLETYAGGTPCFALYHDGNDLPEVYEVPDDVRTGRQVLLLMRRLGEEHQPDQIIYHATGESGCLLVIVMTSAGVLYNMRCPILLEDCTLGPWSIEEHRQE
jgi:hypothetical protein